MYYVPIQNVMITIVKYMMMPMIIISTTRDVICDLNVNSSNTVTRTF